MSVHVKHLFEGSMMLKFCEAFLRHARRWLRCSRWRAVACALCIPAVKVNYSMTDYLPADAPSIQRSTT